MEKTSNQSSIEGQEKTLETPTLINLDSFVEAIHRLSIAEDDKVVRGLEFLILKEKVGGRHQSDSVPFHVTADIKNIRTNCSFAQRTYHKGLRLDIFRCKYPDHVSEYHKTGAMMISCQSCELNAAQEEQQLINNLSKLFKG